MEREIRISGERSDGDEEFNPSGQSRGRFCGSYGAASRALSKKNQKASFSAACKAERIFSNLSA
jgi:hypothetical protein